MVILTSFTSGTYKAQIRSSVTKGFKQLYTATCTSSDEQAAKTVIAKQFPAAAVATLRQVTDADEIHALVGSFFSDPQRKQVFNVWVFNQSAQDPKPEPSAGIIATPPAALAGSPLAVIKTALEAARERLVAAEDVFLNTTLADRLKIGLRAYQAHLIFAVKPDERAGVGGRGKKTESRRDGVSFESWLEAEAPWLKKPTAYKYMTAFRGLGLDETADEDLVEVTLADRRRIALASEAPAPTLANLIAAATDRLAPPAEPPAPPHQFTFDDYVATLKQLREDAEHAIEQAKDMPEPLRKQLVARFYASLHALTGTHWQPSEEAHELGNIDPDTIAL